jgi:hypothetical protein
VAPEIPFDFVTSRLSFQNFELSFLIPAQKSLSGESESHAVSADGSAGAGCGWLMIGDCPNSDALQGQIARMPGIERSGPQFFWTLPWISLLSSSGTGCPVNHRDLDLPVGFGLPGPVPAPCPDVTPGPVNIQLSEAISTT